MTFGIPDIPQEEYEIGYLSHVRDKRSLRETLSLWHCINDKIVERGRPLPRAKFILPKLVAIWNRCKGPIDLYSRFLFNVKARHPQLSPTAVIWLRMIMTCAYNAFMSYGLNGTMFFLISSPNCKSFRDYQEERKTNSGDFKAFLVEMANSMSLLDVNEITAPVVTIPPQVSRVTVLYNTRRCFFPGAEKDKLRLIKFYGNDKVPHGHALIPEKEDENGNVRERARGPQHCCVMCCKAEHKFGRDEQYKLCKRRLAYRPRYYCTLCNVTLCREKKYGGMSCYDLWHILPEIPVYCMNATILNIINETEEDNNPNLGSIDLANDKRVTIEVIKEAISRINSRKGYSKRGEAIQQKSPPPRSARGSLGQRLSFSTVSEVVVPLRVTRSSSRNDGVAPGQQQVSNPSRATVGKKRRNRSRSMRRSSITLRRQSVGSQQSTVSSLQLSGSFSSQRTTSFSEQEPTSEPPTKRRRKT